MKVILFGAGPFTSLAWYCLTHDSEYEVAGFTVDRAYLDRDELHGLPVVDFAEVEQRFPPADYKMLLPVSAERSNGLRMERYLEAKAKGYALITYVSSRAMTWPDLVIGENCMVFEGAILQPFARIGDNTIIRSGCHLSHHVQIADHCFLAPAACLGGGVSIATRSFVGLNATVRNGVNIAERCFIAAGSVVTADTQPDGLYMGVPARRTSKDPSQA